MSPSLELRASVVAALEGSAGVGALVGDRIYDHVPEGAVFPYLTLRVDNCTADDDACGNHWACAVSVHIWSRKKGRNHVEEIAGPVREALDGVDAVTGFVVNYRQFEMERVLDDPDGITTHGIITTEFHIAAL